MTKAADKEFREQYARAKESINKLAAEHGKTTEQFFDGMDILKKYTLEDISCALTHYCFRNGPVEDMHADGKFSQDDMKTLNRYFNYKIFTFLTLLKKNDIATLNGIMWLGVRCGHSWDKPKFNIGDY